MNVLVVEDDPFKYKQIMSEISLINNKCSIDLATSLQQAVDAIYNKVYSCVFLDMAIPSHSSESGATDIYSQPVGGLDVLLYLSDDSRAERVMILTQYPTVEFNREHVPLGKLKAKLLADDITNVEWVTCFTEDGKWKSDIKNFLGEIC